MIRNIMLLCWAVVPAFVFTGLAQAGDKTLAFPGAEGAGAYTVGGRGGEVLFVTNLEDYDPAKDKAIAGSLRAACETKGPRIVVFRVSGTIALKAALTIKEPFITIAGQTAPGAGICLKNYRLGISADNVIIRYMRCRPGDNMEGTEGFRGDNIDSLSISRAKNIIIDHCSTSWSVDETLSSTYTDLITVQWCLITESLNCSAHHKGCHGYGSLVHGGKGAKCSYHHNLYAHHKDRNPRPGGDYPLEQDPEGWTYDFRNNVLYNWAGKGAGYNMDKDKVTRMNFIGNYYISGPNSRGNFAFREHCPYSKAYFSGNWMNGACPEDQWSLVIFKKRMNEENIRAYKQTKPFEVPAVRTDDAYTAYRRVIADAGATLPLRDAVDTRVINHLINAVSGTGDKGKIINDEDEVGGWPELKSASPPKDTDSDGMPDAWEDSYGLNPGDGSDNAADNDRDGYTNIEEFLNATNPTIKD